MNIYVYQAALHCTECALKIKESLGWIDGTDDAKDSDKYPAGPYPNGGGVSDSPQTCGTCRTFLENELTANGREYLAEIVIGHLSDSRCGDRETLQEWTEFYNMDLGELFARANDGEEE